MLNANGSSTMWKAILDNVSEVVNDYYLLLFLQKIWLFYCSQIHPKRESYSQTPEYMEFFQSHKFSFIQPHISQFTQDFSYVISQRISNPITKSFLLPLTAF